MPRYRSALPRYCSLNNTACQLDLTLAYLSFGHIAHRSQSYYTYVTSLFTAVPTFLSCVLCLWVNISSQVHQRHESPISTTLSLGHVHVPYVLVHTLYQADQASLPLFTSYAVWLCTLPWNMVRRLSKPHCPPLYLKQYCCVPKLQCISVLPSVSYPVVCQYGLVATSEHGSKMTRLTSVSIHPNLPPNLLS